MALSRVLRDEIEQKTPNWKAESQENPISKTRGPEDSSISSYGEIETSSRFWWPAFLKKPVSPPFGGGARRDFSKKRGALNSILKPLKLLNLLKFIKFMKLIEIR